MSCGIYQLSELLKNIVFKDEHMSNKAMDGEFDKYFLKTPRRVSREEYLLHFKIRFTNHPTRVWWSQAGSNRRPPACKAGALPAELWPLFRLGLFTDTFVAAPHENAHVFIYTPLFARHAPWSR